MILREDDEYSIAKAVWLHHAKYIAPWQIRHMVNRTDKATFWTPKGWMAIECDVASRLRENCQKLLPTVLYAHSTDGFCKWVALDFDNHSSDPNVAARNLMFAVGILNTLTALGVISIVEDSDGQGGLHLWILFDPPLDIDRAYRFARFIRSDYPDHDIETNPKQRTAGSDGNGLRAPGHHPRRQHVSRFWGDAAWLDAAESVDLLLHAPTNDPDVVSIMGDYDPDRKIIQPIVPKPHFATYSGNGGIVAEAEQAIEQVPWPDLLREFGWHGDGKFWTRAGKDFGTSATLDHGGNGLLHCFSKEAGLPVPNGGKKNGASFGKWRFWLHQSGFDDNRQREAAEYYFRGVQR